jgi:hypothetical protein
MCCATARFEYNLVIPDAQFAAIQNPELVYL